MTHISWWTYIWATGLGILPMTIVLNAFGSSVLTMTTTNWLWLAFVVLVALCMFVIWRRSKTDG